MLGRVYLSMLRRVWDWDATEAVYEDNKVKVHAIPETSTFNGEWWLPEDPSKKIAGPSRGSLAAQHWNSITLENHWSDLRQQARSIETDFVHGLRMSVPSLDRETHALSLPVGRSFGSSLLAHGIDRSRPSRCRVVAGGRGGRSSGSEIGHRSATVRRAIRSKGVAHQRNFRSAYREARNFGKAVARRGGGSGFMKNLLEQRICSSIHAGLSTARTLLEGQTVHEEADEQEADTSIATTEEREVLTRLIDRLEGIKEDPKLFAVLHYLDREKWLDYGVIIFSQYYDTAKWMGIHLPSGIRKRQSGSMQGRAEVGSISTAIACRRNVRR